MRRIPGLAFSLLLLAAGMAHAANETVPRPPPSDEPPLEEARDSIAPGENLIAPPPQGWAMSYSDRDDDRAVYEYIPPGESAEEPRERMTVELAFETKGVSAAQAMERQRREFEQGCDAMAIEPAQDRPVSGQPGQRQTLFCGKLKRGGKGAASIIQVVVGREAIYAIERAWQGEGFRGATIPAAGKAALGQALRDLDAIRLCDTRDKARPCPK